MFEKIYIIQPPGEPREQHLGEVWATQNFIKKNVNLSENIKLCFESWDFSKRRLSTLPVILSFMTFL